MIQRAFCKDVVININSRDFVYPEYPMPEKISAQKVVPNMWRKWIEDTDIDLRKMFRSDIKQG